MGIVADALGELIMQGAPAKPATPSDLPTLAGFFGPVPRRQHPAIARYLSATPPGQLPPKGGAPGGHTMPPCAVYSAPGPGGRSTPATNNR